MPHIHEKIDFTVEVFIVHQDKVLLRKHDKYGIWLSVGGHIELDEDPNEAAVREVKEEVGLDVTLFDNRTYAESSEAYTELIPPQFLNRHRINETHEHVSMIYFGVTDSKDIHNDGAEKSEDIRWFLLQELDNPAFGLLDRVRFHAKAALKQLAK